MPFPYFVSRWLASLLVLGLVGCASDPEPPVGTSSGRYKVGSPYRINGVQYVPREDYGYDQTGVASWYGPGFHGKLTANGEIYDEMQLTAAHPTLPMPSLVRVTNLENGRRLVVRVNDRGPFRFGRVIDMSRRGAQLLGFENQGVARVRVQILARESRALKEAALARDQTALAAAESLLGPEGVSATPEAPRVTAAPRQSVTVTQLAPPPTRSQSPATSSPRPLAPRSQARPARQTTSTVTETISTVPGTVSAGRFLPEPVVETVAVPPVSGIYVQAGAFSVQSNAERLRDRLLAIGPTRITEVVVNNQPFFRVRIGPMDSVAAADEVLARVVQAGNPQARMIVD